MQRVSPRHTEGRLSSLEKNSTGLAADTMGTRVPGDGSYRTTHAGR